MNNTDRLGMLPYRLHPASGHSPSDSENNVPQQVAATMQSSSRHQNQLPPGMAYNFTNHVVQSSNKPEYPVLGNAQHAAETEDGTPYRSSITSVKSHASNHVVVLENGLNPKRPVSPSSSEHEKKTKTELMFKSGQPNLNNDKKMPRTFTQYSRDQAAKKREAMPLPRMTCDTADAAKNQGPTQSSSTEPEQSSINQLPPMQSFMEGSQRFDNSSVAKVQQNLDARKAPEQWRRTPESPAQTRARLMRQCGLDKTSGARRALENAKGSAGASPLANMLPIASDPVHKAVTPSVVPAPEKSIEKESQPSADQMKGQRLHPQGSSKQPRYGISIHNDPQMMADGIYASPEAPSYNINIGRAPGPAHAPHHLPPGHVPIGSNSNAGFWEDLYSYRMGNHADAPYGSAQSVPFGLGLASQAPPCSQYFHPNLVAMSPAHFVHEAQMQQMQHQQAQDIRELHVQRDRADECDDALWAPAVTALDNMTVATIADAAPALLALLQMLRTVPDVPTAPAARIGNRIIRAVNRSVASKREEAAGNGAVTVMIEGKTAFKIKESFVKVKMEGSDSVSFDGQSMASAACKASLAATVTDELSGDEWDMV